MKCEKCGRELTAIEFVMENFDGGNTITNNDCLKCWCLWLAQEEEK